MIQAFQRKGSKVAVLASFLGGWLLAGLHSLEFHHPDPFSLSGTLGAAKAIESKVRTDRDSHDSRFCMVCSSIGIASPIPDEPIEAGLSNSGLIQSPEPLPELTPSLVATLARGPPLL
jgi:hypothetical protein